jgi:hypothetical protein
VVRTRRSPDLGPRILFFTGGTALRETSQALVEYTHNSVHLVTPFDSGGSSAALRRHFDMPAVGDLRSRLMALADRSLHGYPEIYSLFAHRLPKTSSPDQLRAELDALANGVHPLIAKVSDPMRKIIRHHLQIFAKAAGGDFDLRGASVGNLILTAGYLDSRRHIDPIVFIYSKLVQVRGEVRLLINSNLHLRAQLEGGGHLIGQHLITGKETPPDQAHRRTVPRRPGQGECARAAHDPRQDPRGHRRLRPDLLSRRQLLQLPDRHAAARGRGQGRQPDPLPQGLIPNTFHDPESIGMSLEKPGAHAAAPPAGRRIPTPSPSATCWTSSCSIPQSHTPAPQTPNVSWPLWEFRSSGRPSRSRKPEPSTRIYSARRSFPWCDDNPRRIIWEGQAQTQKRHDQGRSGPRTWKQFSPA